MSISWPVLFLLLQDEFPVNQCLWGSTFSYNSLISCKRGVFQTKGQGLPYTSWLTCSTPYPVQAVKGWHKAVEGFFSQVPGAAARAAALAGHGPETKGQGALGGEGGRRGCCLKVA